MITIEQAQLLASEAALDFVRKHGRNMVEGMTLIEYVKFTECLAATIYREADSEWATPEKRDQVLMKLAGSVMNALCQHGDRLFTNHQLQRSLHLQQATQKSLLLETQFTRSEAGDAYKACKENPNDTEAWARLRGALAKLGVNV